MHRYIFSLNYFSICNIKCQKSHSLYDVEYHKIPKDPWKCQVIYSIALYPITITILLIVKFRI